MTKEYFGDKPEKLRFACNLGFHEWCLQSGFDYFYFCNYCGLVNRNRV